MIYESCYDCGGYMIVSNGHHVCTECGLVQSREYKSPEGVSSPRTGTGIRNRMHIVDGLGSYMGYPREKVFSASSLTSVSGRINENSFYFRERFAGPSGQGGRPDFRCRSGCHAGTGPELARGVRNTVHDRARDGRGGDHQQGHCGYPGAGAKDGSRDWIQRSHSRL